MELTGTSILSQLLDKQPDNKRISCQALDNSITISRRIVYTLFIIFGIKLNLLTYSHLAAIAKRKTYLIFCSYFGGFNC